MLRENLSLYEDEIINTLRNLGIENILKIGYVNSVNYEPNQFYKVYIPELDKEIISINYLVTIQVIVGEYLYKLGIANGLQHKYGVNNPYKVAIENIDINNYENEYAVYINIFSKCLLKRPNDLLIRNDNLLYKWVKLDKQKNLNELEDLI